VPKLTLLEIWPLNVFIGDRQNLSVVDVGANTGMWCQAFMNTFGEQTARYEALEPLSGNLDVFRHRMSDKQVRFADAVTLHHCCAGPENGTVDIHYPSEVSTLASVVLESVEVGGRVVENSKSMAVPQVALDSFAETQSLDSIDLLKIDVEGYEWEVLQGARQLIADARIGMIYFEFGQHQGSLQQSFRQFWDHLRASGFEIYRQSVGRNFFGLQHIESYHPSLEDFSSMWMVLASRRPLLPGRNSPFVVGRYSPPATAGARARQSWFRSLLPARKPGR